MADAKKPLPTVLVVAEKRRMARDITIKLCPNGRYRTDVMPTKNDGDHRRLEVSTFEADFKDPIVGRSTRAIFKVTATHGYLYHIDFKDLAVRIGSRATIDSADFAFDDYIGKYAPQKEAPEKGTGPTRENQPDKRKIDNRVTNSAIHDLLRAEALHCDYVVLFLDCDLAGEHICFQVIDVIRGQHEEHHGRTFDVSRDVDEQPNEQSLKAIVGKARSVTVEDSEQTRKQPEALNTIVMLAKASEQLKMQPKETMELAQKLYEAGYVTYPRTDATDYPHNFDFRKTAEAIIAKPRKDIMQSPVGCVTGLQPLKQDIKRCAEAAEQRYSSAPAARDRFDRAFAHPPNVPTCNMCTRCPDGPLRPLYGLIACHFLASISDEMVCKKKTMKMDVDGWGSDSCTANYTKVTADGFTRYLPQERPIDHSEFEAAVEGEYKLKEFRVQELYTEPSGLLKISELVRSMGDYFLGTSGTIAEHIHKLVSVYEYVEVEGEETLSPQPTGVKLVELLQKHAPELASPEYRQDVHRRINEVAKGEKSKDEVVKDVINEVYWHYKALKRHLEAADETQFQDWGFPKRPRKEDHSTEASSFVKSKRT